MDSIKSSVQTAFYTPPGVTVAIGSVLRSKGIKPNRLLDPSAGMGVFPKMIANPSGDTSVWCVDQDPLSCRILSLTHPEYNIINDSFQSTGDRLNGQFDVVTSNIPFGNFRVFDMAFDRSKEPGRHAAQSAIHNYYFIKGIDTLREGGLLAFITSQGVMNSPANLPVREWLMQNSNLVSAIRLPHNLFKGNAGTEVGTDLIVLQKRTGKKELSQDERDFIVSNQFGDTGLPWNKYFDRPDRVLSTSSEVKTFMYKPSLILDYNRGRDMFSAELANRLGFDMDNNLNKWLYQNGGNNQTNRIIDTVAEDVTQKPVQADLPKEAVAEVLPQEPEQAETVDQSSEQRRVIDDPGRWPDSYKTDLNYTHAYMDFSGRQRQERQAEPEIAKEPEKEIKEQATPDNEDKTGQTPVSGSPAPAPPPAPSVRQPISQRRRGGRVQTKANPDARQLDMFSAVPPPSATQTPATPSPQVGQPAAEFARQGSLFGSPVTPPEQSRRQPAGHSYPIEDARAEEHRRRYYDAYGRFPEDDIATQEAKSDLTPRPFIADRLAHYRDGTVVIDSGQVGKLSEGLDGFTFNPMNLNDSQAGRLKQYVPLRDSYMALWRTETETQKEQRHIRDDVNGNYDRFVNTFGDLNTKENVKLLLTDPSGMEVLSLERFVDGRKEKADILSHPIAFNTNEVTKVDSVDEALAASLNKFGKVDLSYMEALCGVEGNQMIDDLHGRIYFNPLSGGWENKDTFISGNVVEKLKLIEAHLKEHPGGPHGDTALEALKAAVPERITYEELDFNFGERWIPTGVYSRFASYLYDTDVKINYSPRLDAFGVQCERYNARINTEYCVRGHHRRYDGIHLLEHALLNTVPDITKTIKDETGEDIKVRDAEKIQLADTLITKIRSDFNEWLDMQSPDFKQRLCDIYNDKYNCFVRPQYDGSHQQFPGLDMAGLQRNFGIDEIYGSQKDVVWMLKQNGGGICDHEVGTGKTLSMCIAAMEMKRLGLADKPMIMGLKANTEDIAKTFRIAYPNARILYPGKEDFEPKNRLKLLNQIKNNDWDAVILTHDQFAKIPQSPEIQRKIFTDEIHDIDENLDVLRKDGVKVNNWMLKGLETRKKNLKEKLWKLETSLNEKRDDAPDFKSMGIDHIFVDESQQFKNLMFNTRHTRVAGLGNSAGSQRAANLLFAIRTIQDKTGKDLGATFLSGTTISNSLTELYLLFKYLRPRALEKQDIPCFDAWAAVFAKKTTDYEFSVTNQIIQKERFRYFIKVPELANFYNEITDYRTAESVGVDRPDLNQSLLALEPSKAQLEYLDRLVAFAAGGDASLIGREELSEAEETARMLLTTNYANKMSLDMRLIDSDEYNDSPTNKATVCAKKIAEYYHKYDEQKGTQLVFSDLGTYKPDQWNIYSEIKRKLIEDHGIPEHEIRFIQEATNQKKRNAFRDGMNAGTIRVGFGSSQKLGTGNNVQEKVVAMHHLDIPWTPKDLTQRNGRGRRTGNKVAKLYADNKVDSIVYATERSLDSYKFGVLTNKQLFIDQIKSGTLGTRTIDEGAFSEDGGMSYAEMAAITSGNTDLLDLAKMEKKIAALESERSAFNRNKGDATYRLGCSQTAVRNHTALIEGMKADIAARDGLNIFDAEEKIVNNPLKIDGVSSSDMKVIAERLHSIEKTVRTGGDFEQIGTLGAFKVYVKTDTWEFDRKLEYSNLFYISGEGKVKYRHNNGQMPKDPELACTSFVKALEKIEGLVAKSEKVIADENRDIPIFQKVVDSTFSKDAELKTAIADRDALKRKIDLDLKPIREQVDKGVASGNADQLAENLKHRIHERYGQTESQRNHLDNHVVIGGIPPPGRGMKI